MHEPIASREGATPRISITDADMVALLHLPQDAYWSEATLMELLVATGVARGFDEQAFRAACRGPAGTPVPIARGRAPVDGDDAHISFPWLEAPGGGEPGRPRERADGGVDLRELRLVRNVRKGEVLAVKHPAGAGIPGFTVLGAVLPARPGQDCRLTAGRNAELSADGSTLVALVDGEPELDRGRIGVTPVLIVTGNVNFGTGNIDFAGSVHVRGDVLPGFRVRAAQAVRVDGMVEGGLIEAGGAVMVRGGVRRGAEVRARGDVHVLFVDTDAAIMSSSSIMVEQSAVHARLDAAFAIAVGQALVGGSARAGELIRAGQVGKPSGVATALAIEQALQWEAIGELQYDLARLSAQQAAGQEDAELAGALERLAGELSRRQRRVIGRAAVPLVVARDALHPGVTLVLNGELTSLETALSPS